MFFFLLLKQHCTRRQPTTTRKADHRRAVVFQTQVRLTDLNVSISDEPWSNQYRIFKHSIGNKLLSFGRIRDHNAAVLQYCVTVNLLPFLRLEYENIR